MITIKILADNRPSPSLPALETEHGLSLWVECNGVSILVDTGASELFLRNAERLGVSVASADFALLSHAHNDHTGGLCSLARRCGGVPLYIAPESFALRCYSLRGGVRRDISAPKLADRQQVRFVEVESLKVGDAWIVRAADCGYPTPNANRFLTAEEGGVERADEFSHELSLCLDSPQGLVIISPCSHRGAANIIASCRRASGKERVAAFVGGLHLPDYDGVKEEAAEVAKTIAEVAPDAIVYTGHCTSDRAIATLGELLPNLRVLHTGVEIKI